MAPNQFRPHRPRAAFTLIELMVVLVILGILAAIALALAGKVTGSGKAKVTQDVLRILDQVLTSYISDKGGAPPQFYTDDQGSIFPMIDGRADARTFPILNFTGAPPTTQLQQYDRDRDPAQPTTTLFLLEASKVAAVQSILQSIDSKLVERRTVNAWGWRTGSNTLAQFDENAGNQGPLTGLVVKDGWGFPVRYVSPAFHGGHGRFQQSDGTLSAANLRGNLAIRHTRQGSITPLTAEFSRSYRPFDNTLTGPPFPVGDSDEGICSTGRAYFYSVGADGDPGTRSDNVYLDSNKPSFPTETAKLEN